MNESAYLAYLTRLRWINRWRLMRNAYQENVMEHSWEMATIVYTLALIKNRIFGGQVDANRCYRRVVSRRHRSDYRRFAHPYQMPLTRNTASL